MNNLKERLVNYKKTQEKTAKAKGVYDKLMSCTTITQAKKVVYGEKQKSYSGWKGHPDWVSSNMPGGRNK